MDLIELDLFFVTYLYSNGIKLNDAINKLNY